MHSILVTDYMDHNPHAIHATTSIKEAVTMMLKEGVIGAPVVDKNNQLIGYLSEQDCVKDMLNDAFYSEEPGPVSSAMQTEVVSVTPETSIVEIAQTIMTNRPKNYPVVTDGKLVGLISRSDVLRALLEHEEDGYFSKPKVK
ncbi:CBS domain protein [gamma proteobacterium IMCC1989]|nr:CBS domain protein [gamma proteobacterium IMCC1989]